MDNFLGSWTEERCENIDSFLGAINIGFMLRNLAKTQTPTIEFSQAGDVITIKTITTFKTENATFKLNEEFEEKRLDGNIVKTTATLDGGALVLTKAGEYPYVVTHTIEDGKLKISYKAGDVEGIRIAKKN